MAMGFRNCRLFRECRLFPENDRLYENEHRSICRTIIIFVSVAVVHSILLYSITNICIYSFISYFSTSPELCLYTCSPNSVATHCYNVCDGRHLSVAFLYAAITLIFSLYTSYKISPSFQTTWWRPKRLGDQLTAQDIHDFLSNILDPNLKQFGSRRRTAPENCQRLCSSSCETDKMTEDGPEKRESDSGPKYERDCSGYVLPPNLRNEIGDPLYIRPKFRIPLNSLPAIVVQYIFIPAIILVGIQILVTRSDSSDWSVAAIFAIVAAVTGSFFTVFELRGRVRASSRQEWINRIREDLAELIQNARIEHLRNLQGGTPPTTGAKQRKHFHEHHQKRVQFELFLNPSEIEHRALLALIRAAYNIRGPHYLDDELLCHIVPACMCENGVLSPSEDMLNINKDQLVTAIIVLSQLVLKREWERVKYTR